MTEADVWVSPLLPVCLARNTSHQHWGNTWPCDLTHEEHREFHGVRVRAIYLGMYQPASVSPQGLW